MIRQLRSFLLPFVVVILVPFLLLFDFRSGLLKVVSPLPVLQIVVGGLLCLVGLTLLVATISLFIRQGRGTLAPWDPTSHLVVEGPYGFTRNPMISSVAFAVLGEAVVFGSLFVLGWFVVVVVLNTVYFKLSEEPGLVKRFGGEYVEYRKNVPMWVPRLRPWRKATGGRK